MLFKRKVCIHTQRLSLKPDDDTFPTFRMVTVDVLINGKVFLSELTQVNCCKGTRYFEMHSFNDHDPFMSLVNANEFKYRGRIKNIDIIIRGPQFETLAFFPNCEFGSW